MGTRGKRKQSDAGSALVERRWGGIHKSEPRLRTHGSAPTDELRAVKGNAGGCTGTPYRESDRRELYLVRPHVRKASVPFRKEPCNHGSTSALVKSCLREKEKEASRDCYSDLYRLCSMSRLNGGCGIKQEVSPRDNCGCLVLEIRHNNIVCRSRLQSAWEVSQRAPRDLAVEPLAAQGSGVPPRLSHLESSIVAVTTYPIQAELAYQ